MLLLDLWQPERPGDVHKNNVELAVSFAATVVADLCRKGQSNVYLATTGVRPECSGGPASAALLQDMLEELALIEPQSGDHLAELFRQALARTDSGAELVLVTTRPLDPSSLAGLDRMSADPVGRAMLRRMRVVDTSNPELSRYFQMD